MWINCKKVFIFSFSENDHQEYRIYGLCATEVEVDILTGQQQINRVDIIEDVGDSMSPLIDIGQCEGAFVMGKNIQSHSKSTSVDLNLHNF